MNKYIEQTKALILSCCAACNGGCGYHIIDQNDPDTIVVTIPAPSAINGVIEVKISVMTNGLDVMWYYASTVLKEDKDHSSEEKLRIAADISISYNNFTDRSDELATHSLCINREDGDIYWHAFYNRRLFFPWTTDGIPVFKDIFCTQPQRLEKMCYPIIAALIGRADVEDAISTIETIRDD